MKEFVEKLLEKIETLSHDNPMVTQNYILRKDIVETINQLAEERGVIKKPMNKHQMLRAEEIIWLTQNNIMNDESKREYYLALDIARKSIKELIKYQELGSLGDFEYLKKKEHNYDNCHNLTCRKLCERDGYNAAIKDFSEQLNQAVEYRVNEGPCLCWSKFVKESINKISERLRGDKNG